MAAEVTLSSATNLSKATAVRVVNDTGATIVLTIDDAAVVSALGPGDDRPRGPQLLLIRHSVQIVLRLVLVVAGLAGAARCHELLTTFAGVTRRGGFGKLCCRRAEIIELALEVVHVRPDVGLGPGRALIGARCKASLHAKLRRVVEVLCPGRKQGVVPFDLALHHVTHRREGHAQQREVGLPQGLQRLGLLNVCQGRA